MKELIERAIQINQELGAKIEEMKLTKVEVSESTFKVGDRCILWNEDKSDAVIGKLTEINNTSDITYEVGSMWGYRHCIKFESMEQYNEFIEE